MERKNNRRGFLTQVGMAGVAVGASALGLNATGARADSKAAEKPVAPKPTALKPLASPLDKFSRADFAQHLQTAFRVTVKNKDGALSTVDLTLAVAEDLKGNDPKRGIEAFSLVFSGPAAALTQETYLFSHPKMGKFDLFLVPAGTKDAVPHYRATFFRLKTI